jgi:hypothetical protein
LQGWLTAAGCNQEEKFRRGKAFSIWAIEARGLQQ